MEHNVYLYLIVAALTVYALRALPLTLIRKKIENTFIYSFLYYVPYVTLAVMTFPAILESTGHWISAAAGFVVALIVAYKDGNLFKVALSACICVFVLELFLPVYL